MTNLAHWQDDIDDALGGDFDGSLSGLCLMSLSFDFTRNAAGSHLGATREAAGGAGPAACQPAQQPAGARPSMGSPASFAAEASYNDSTLNCFKRFKSMAQAEQGADDENRPGAGTSKIARQLQQLKSCLTTASLATNGTLTTHYSSVALSSQAQAPAEPESGRHSPSSPEASCERASGASTPEDSSRASSAEPRSPSESGGCSSVSSESRASSRSSSPADGRPASSARPAGAQGEQRAQPAAEGQQVSLYSVKDSLLGGAGAGATLKESSYTTSVITTTAPIHFKSLHHPFSLKQFPPSPYHQFSNSSLNHDFYDRYMSHDSHQPLQTPLIGIERTQDLLSLRLPPHGHEDVDSQKFHRDWPSFDGPQRAAAAAAAAAADKPREPAGPKARPCEARDNQGPEKGFPFNYKSNSDGAERPDQREPIDLNVSYVQPDGQQQQQQPDDECCQGETKNHMFNESMKHFSRHHQAACYDLSAKQEHQPEASSRDQHEPDAADGAPTIGHQYHGQESMFGAEPAKQRFNYLLAAPISVATKLNEDTMTYLNQGQAYEIKLENTTDLAEAKKGFMCSIVNIGFHERHMQQAEHELWQQWSHQHPNEKIFSVDMKLSYNVFGVESDGLNKYEFLWDSSKAAGVFIRINSISTEFTPKKHGGEKGVPFKLSIETFSYNSKTHDSYFISAACCQIKVFKPKGAERKIRSDRDKIFKRPPGEQEKYHRSCDHTTFRECSLTSLHPTADGSLCYYRHSHGHFASKQVVSSNGVGGSTSAQQHQAPAQNVDELNERPDNAAHSELSPQTDPSDSNRANQVTNDSDTTTSNTQHQRDYLGHNPRNLALPAKSLTDYATHRLIQGGHYAARGQTDTQDQPDQNCGPISSHNTESGPFNHPNDLPSQFNQMYHNSQVRGVAGLPINGTHNFGMAYYGHSLPPPPMAPHIPPAPAGYGISSSVSVAHHQGHTAHSFPVPSQQHLAPKTVPSIYRQLNHDSKPSAASHSSGSFKGSSFAFPAHNNFQGYPASHSSDACSNVDPSQDAKDGSSIRGGSGGGHYQHENYDSHSANTNIPHSQQSACRQRSASTSLAVGHCNGYNQTRLADNFASDNHQWVQSSSGYPQATGANYTLKCNTISHNGDANGYGSTGSYDCNNQHFDSEQSSPQKSQHHTSDSSSSCYSKYKNATPMLPFHPQDDHNEPTRCSPRCSRITINSDCNEVATWFIANRFNMYSKTFNNFSGSDLLRLAKQELIEICGLIDGIRLYNGLHNQPIRPRRVLYVCHESSEIFHPVYLYDVTLRELLRELSDVFGNLISSCRTQLMEDKHNEKQTVPHSGSSTDSRSSIGAISSETANDDAFCRADNFFNERKCNAMGRKSPIRINQQAALIGRLLVDGLASVKIVATEQVVQMLDDESVWKLSFNYGNSGFIEACISVCHSNRRAQN